MAAQDLPPLDRRRLLLGAGLVLGAATLGGAGCGTLLWHPRPVSADEGALLLAIAAKQRLVERYEVTVPLGAPEGMAALLEANLEHHHMHLDTLRGRLPDRHEDDPAPAPSLGPQPDAALSASGLEAAERSASARSGRLAADAEDAANAQLLASVAACEAVHAELLRATA